MISLAERLPQLNSEQRQRVVFGLHSIAAKAARLQLEARLTANRIQNGHEPDDDRIAEIIFNELPALAEEVRRVGA